MRVKELIEKLQEYPSDMLVALSSDPEGNSFELINQVVSMETTDIDELNGKYYDNWLVEELSINSSDHPSIIVIWP